MNDGALNGIRRVTLPIIRKVFPELTVQELVDVQPMSIDCSTPIETGISHNINGTVEFYWVEPAQEGYTLFNNPSAAKKIRDRNESIIQWCIQTYGPRGIWGVDLSNSNGARWYTSDQKFYFRNAADRTLFVLRWE